MQVQTTNQNILQKKTSFKSAYPVYHWVSDMGSKYSRAVTLDLNKKLNSTVVSLANHKKKVKNKEINELAEKVQKFLSEHDTAFSEKMISRSYYSYNQAYLITGKDVDTFVNHYSKWMGKAKALPNAQDSAELNIARNNYYIGGLNFVKNKSAVFLNKDRQCCALHTQFKTIRNKNGDIEGYKLIGACYLPIADMQTYSEKLNSRIFFQTLF